MLRVAAAPRAIESPLAELVPCYRRRHIGVKVHLVEDGGAQLPRGLDVATSMSQPCQPATLGSAVGCSIRCTSWPCYRSFITWAAGRRYVTELADELLRRTPSFASHGWLHAACHVAHVRPRVRHKSVAAQTLIALAKAGHGIVLVPSAVRIARAGVSVAVVVHRKVPLGQWTVAAWDPQRYLAPYAGYPGREYVRAAPRLLKPKAG
jgi:DNA-binding transcriptional LysR family regulator